MSSDKLGRTLITRRAALAGLAAGSAWLSTSTMARAAEEWDGVVSAANSISLVLLCVGLLHHHAENGTELLGSGLVLWATNVLLFGVWYWLLDRGGPAARADDDCPTHPDFLFVQMTQPAYAPANWKPRLVDYLYTSFTNATAFSPTDTMPLTAPAKWLMAGQALVSLVTIGLVVARAVNILS